MSALLILAGATLLPAAQAAAEKVRYCVINSAETHGLFTSDAYFCGTPGSTSCAAIDRDHFFSFGDAQVDESCSTTLTVDYGTGAAGSPQSAVLHGRLGGNKTALDVDVDLQFTGLHLCTEADDVRWPAKFGPFPQDDAAFPPADASIDSNLYCADSIGDAAADGVPAGDGVGGIGGPGQGVDQRIAPIGGTLQLGSGGNGMRRDEVGGFARFPVNVSGADGIVVSKLWDLGMTLVNPVVIADARVFDVVLCPSDDVVDDGAGQGEEVAGRKDCSICWFGEKNADGSCADETFVSTFKNEPGLWGRITLDGQYEIPDPRVHCNPDAAPGTVNPVGPQTVAPGVTVTVDTVTPPARPGMRIAGSALTGDVYIPWYICGIPNENSGQAFVRLINANSDFHNTNENPRFRDVINSVVIHDADGVTGSQNSNFECSDTVLTNRDPVVAWLPRTDEIPLPGAGRQIRDVTSGCGSTRGGSSTRSYLLSNLVYARGAGSVAFRNIIGAEIDMLEETLVQAGAAVTPAGVPSSCVVARQNVIANLFPDPYAAHGSSRYIDHMRANFDAGNYVQVIRRLEWLLGELGVIDGTTDTLDQTASLYSAFDTCYYDGSRIVNLAQYPALAGQYPPADSGNVPRNFRGDLQAQAEHIIWNIRQNMLAKP